MNIKSSLLSTFLGVGIFTTISFATATPSQLQVNDLAFQYSKEAVNSQPESRIFTNIQKREGKHMNLLKGVLKKYEIGTPVIINNEGCFEASVTV